MGLGMSSRDWKFRIQDIIKAIEKYIDSMSLADFKRNDLVMDAVERNFEIIGEASKNVPNKVQNTYPEIPWKEMAGMRNILIHVYFGIDVKLVWHTATKYLPQLKVQLLNLLKETKE
jgi:uncharacterized protein with HEPN domain